MPSTSRCLVGVTGRRSRPASRQCAWHPIHNTDAASRRPLPRRTADMIMKIFVHLLLVASCAVSPYTQADQATPSWTPLRGQFLIHSGHATYAEPPTSAHSAITVAFEGKPAKEVFDQMGLDAKVQCSIEKGDRERRNKGAVCTYTAKLGSPSESHYRCWIGVDLRTGEGNQGVSC